MDITYKNIFTRRNIYAMTIFFGLSMTAEEVFAMQKEYLYTDERPVIELNFFDADEFHSIYDFNEILIEGARGGFNYWKNLLDVKAKNIPWQIVFARDKSKLVKVETFSFDEGEYINDNYVGRMLKNNQYLRLFDTKILLDHPDIASGATKNGSSAITVVTIGSSNYPVASDTILPTNDQNVDLVSDLRLKIARALGVEVSLDDTGKNFDSELNDWTANLVDSNGMPSLSNEQIITREEFDTLQKENPKIDESDFFIADKKIFFNGSNVKNVLGDTTFDDVYGLPINAWNGKTFDGVQTLIPGLMSASNYKNYSTFTELELAALQDIGFKIDRKKYFGRSIYQSNETLSNSKDFTSDSELAIGLHLWGEENNITQSGDISLSGAGSVGVRVDGLANKIDVAKDSMITSSGADGKGILISYGRDHVLNVDGTITVAQGNAIEFNFGSNMLGAAGEYRGSYMRYLRGLSKEYFAKILPLTITDDFSYEPTELKGALVNDFNISGQIAGGKNAIYIGKNAFVDNININEGAQIFGNITSDWKHLDYPNLKLQYDQSFIYPDTYVPNLVTKLNINSDFIYNGDIKGSDNLKLNIKNGTFNYAGSADILSVDVAKDAKLFGGTFTLNDMRDKIASKYIDDTTGKFYNHGTIGAASGDKDLIINGDLISDGTLQKVSGGEKGSIIVTGNANIDGSVVTSDSLLPNETSTVLIADSITGAIKNAEDNPIAISALLNATGKIVDNKVTITTESAIANKEWTPKEANTLDAMQNMLDNLEEDNKKDEMRALYNLDVPETKQTLNQISSNDSAQVISVAQQNTSVDTMISNRITDVFSMNNLDFSTLNDIVITSTPFYFADTDNNESEVKKKVRKSPENNFWINYMKSWGSISDTNYHGTAIVGGYDRPIGKNLRAGILATYGTIAYGAEASRATIYDTRVGLYAGYNNRASNIYLYLNGGQLRNNLHRSIAPLGLSPRANYNSRIIEIGGEYKYSLNPKKVWKISPFVNFQASHLNQNSYNEYGAGVYNQHVDALSNTYFAAQLGLDLKRYYSQGMFGMRVGVKHGFTGIDPDLTIRYEGALDHSYRLRQKRDKTHFLISLRGDNEFARNWFVSSDTELQFSEHDRDLTASLMLRRIW